MQSTLPSSKPFWIKTVLSLFIFIFIISCEKDEIQYVQIEQKRSFNVETITHKTASSNQLLLSSFDLVKQSFNSLHSKSGAYYDTINNIEILTDRVKYISTGEYESYTYGIKKEDNSNELHNLLFSKNSTGSFESFLVTYDLNKVTTAQLATGNLKNLDLNYIAFQKITTDFVAKLDVTYAGVGNCIASITYDEGQPCGRTDGPPHAYGNSECTLTGSRAAKEATLVIVSEACQTNGGGGANDDPFSGDNGYPDSSGNPSNGGGANTDGTNSNNDTDNDTPEDCIYDNNNQCIGEVTSPVLPRLPLIVSPLTHEFFETLYVDEKEYINNSDQNELRIVVDAFLLEEEHSELAKDFAKEAIKEKMEDEGTEIDFENNSMYDPTVPECLKDIIDRFKPTENFSLDVSGFENALQQQLNIAGQTLALFDNDGGYGIKFDVKELDGANAQTMPQFKNINGNRVFTGVEISFHEGYVARATDLGLARSTVHELIHAYLLYATYAENPTSLGETMDDLLDEFDIGPAHHGLMSRQFAGAISGALQSWDNYAHPSQEYDYLSWSGAMISSEEFLNLSSDYQNEVWERMFAEEGRLFPLNSGFINTPALGERNCN